MKVKNYLIIFTLFILLSCFCNIIYASSENSTDISDYSFSIEIDCADENVLSSSLASGNDGGNGSNKESIKTFTDLANQINETDDGSVLNLNESFKYNSSSDESLCNGVVISKNLTIIGNNCTIDGSQLARCFFIDTDCSVILNNITIMNGYSKNNGSGIFLSTKSNLTLINCTFCGNKVYQSNGGAIYGQNQTNIEVFSCNFYNNTGVRGSNLPWEEFKAGMGSAICVMIGSALKLYDSVFTDHVSHLTVILLVSFSDYSKTNLISDLHVENCLFENNTSRSNGVIYLDELGTGSIVNSSFRNNVITSSGGTISLDSAYSATVEDCLFENNSAIRGGAIYVPTYDGQSQSNVTITNCTFSKNIASEYGGAIYAKNSLLKISNSNFNDNVAGNNGGAVCTYSGETRISNCSFDENSAGYGGALFLKSDEVSVVKSSFVKNIASQTGGAIYSNTKKVSSSGCSYVKNSANKASIVYGLFNAKVTKYTSASGSVKLKIILSSPWKMSLAQKIKVKFNGYTSKWLKTSSNGKLVFTVPKNKKVTKKSLSITMNLGFCVVKTWIYKDPGKITVSKTVKKSSKLTVKIKNKYTGKTVKKTKFKIKIYTGKKYKTYNVKTSSKGIIKISMKKFKVGKHKISFYLSSDDYYVNKKLSFKIKK